MTITPPTMPDNSTVYQSMVDTFGTAGTIAVAVIGAAVSLGVISMLGMFAWRMAKKWISSAK